MTSATVVFPVPAGPHSTSDDTWSASISRRSGGARPQQVILPDDAVEGSGTQASREGLPAPQIAAGSIGEEAVGHQLRVWRIFPVGAARYLSTRHLISGGPPT